VFVVSDAAAPETFHQSLLSKSPKKGNRMCSRKTTGGVLIKVATESVPELLGRWDPSGVTTPAKLVPFDTVKNRQKSLASIPSRATAAGPRKYLHKPKDLLSELMHWSLQVLGEGRPEAMPLFHYRHQVSVTFRTF